MGTWFGPSRKSAVEERSITIADHDGVMNNWVDASPLDMFLPDSMRVTSSSAFTSTIAVYACVALIAETIASLPLLLYDRISDESRERIPEQNETPGPLSWQSRLARMLHQSPNPEMTSQEFWETTVGHVALWGNAYSNVVRTNGRPEALWPLRPDRMKIERVGGKRVYIYTMLDGEQRRLGSSEVMHIHALSLDGVYGVSPIQAVARSAVRIMRASEAMAEGFYRRGGVPAGILHRETPFPGNAEQQREAIKLTREAYESMHSGFDNANRIAVLAGVTWQDVGMPLEAAQFLETRRFQLNEIARLYRIPPHMVGDVDRSTSWGEGIANQAQGFLTFTLRPWLERIEQAVGRDLGFPGEEAQTLLDEGIFAEFEPAGLLRADKKSQYEAYAVALQNKFMTPNQVRALENMEPLEGGDNVIELPGQTGQQAAQEAAASREFIAALVGRENPQPNITANLTVPEPHIEMDMSKVAAAIERSSTEQAKMMAGLEDRSINIEVDTAPIAAAVDRVSAANEEFAVENREIQARLFDKIEELKPKPMRRVVERNGGDLITALVDYPVEVE